MNFLIVILGGLDIKLVISTEIEEFFLHLRTHASQSVDTNACIGSESSTAKENVTFERQNKP